MEYLTLYVIIFFWGAVVAAVLFVPAIILGFFVMAFISVRHPQSFRRRVAFLAAGTFPLMAVMLELFAIGHIYSDKFRGPEILGVIILGVAAALAVFVVWPLSYWLTVRQFGLLNVDTGAKDGVN